MKTIMLSNQKGGVAKTTTALALASGLASKGYKVLAIDCDPQCNFTFSSNINPLEIKGTLFNLFERNVKAKDIIEASSLGYDIIAGDLRLSTADLKYSGQISREYMLLNALKGIEAEYNYCIIDTPPQIGLLVENALAITDSIIIPLTADVYALQGLANYADLLKQFKEYMPTASYEIEGILITRYSDRTKLTKLLNDNILELAESMETKVFNTKIRETVAVRETPLDNRSIFESHPEATATEDYKAFIDELLEGGL